MSGKLREQKLDHPEGRTELVSGVEAISFAEERFGDWLSGRTLFILSSDRVRGLHGHELTGLRRMARRTIELEVPDGEEAKTIEIAGGLWEQMLAAGGKRSSRLITFGGGTVGDLGGFVAGCFLRGIDWAQIPTTLLAQVDAAIGGKTAVDLPGGKNTVGLFHHPAWVLSDTSVLRTLPGGELRSGLVEVIKMALLLDPPLLDAVEGSLEKILAGDAEALAPIVAAAAAAKIAVVEADPSEGDLRRILNFGHTLGHAIEGVLKYELLRHGEAVAYGMLFAERLARRRGLVKKEFGERLRALLGRLNLPPLKDPRLLPDSLMDFMGRDKKATEAGIVWILPKSTGGKTFGAWEMVPAIPQREILKELQSFLEEPFAS